MDDYNLHIINSGECGLNQLTFLGTGDAMGVPRVYCDCEVCTEARLTGENKRKRSSVLIDGGGDGAGEQFMIDCGPDWRSQMEDQGLRMVHTSPSLMPILTILEDCRNGRMHAGGWV